MKQRNRKALWLCVILENDPREGARRGDVDQMYLLRPGLFHRNRSRRTRASVHSPHIAAGWRHLPMYVAICVALLLCHPRNSYFRKPDSQTLYIVTTLSPSCPAAISKGRTPGSEPDAFCCCCCSRFFLLACVPPCRQPLRARLAHTPAR